MPVIEGNSLVAQYIRAIENPDSIGYNNGRWEAPTHKAHDSNISPIFNTCSYC